MPRSAHQDARYCIALGWVDDVPDEHLLIEEVRPRVGSLHSLSPMAAHPMATKTAAHGLR
jgi:hypothetical protein